MLGSDGSIYEFGSFRVHPLNRTLEKEGALIPLSSRALDVLLLLLSKRGRVVSKEELLNTVWPDTHVEESSLPVLISSIRKAIGDDGRSQRYIQTVAKCGYRIIGEVRECPVEPPAVPISAIPLNAPPVGFVPAFLRVRPRLALIVAATIVFAATFLAGSGMRGMPEHPPRTSAGTWYAKGRYAWNLQTRASILQALEYFEKAIAEEPNYALAWAGIAECYVSLPSYSHNFRQPGIDKARDAARRAMQDAPELAESYLAEGMVSMIADRDLYKAESELREAVRRDPNSPLAQGELGLLLAPLGRSDEAIEHAQRAAQLDRLSIRAATDLGIVLFYGGRYEDALKEFAEVLRLDPFAYRAHTNLGRTYLALGRFDEAKRAFAKASSLSDRDPVAEGFLAEAAARGGDKETAQSILASLEQRAQQTYVAPSSLAYAYMGLGQYDRVIDNLRKAQSDRTIAAIYLKVDPNWKDLRSAPEFRALTRDLP